MITKIYGIYGYREVLMQIMVGKAKLPINFTNGNPAQGANYRAATYASTSEIEQEMIEKSYQFKTGKIQVIRTYGKKSEKTAPAKEAKPAAPIVDDVPQEDNEPATVPEVIKKSYPKIVNMSGALITLKSNGATAEILKDPNAMKAFMEEKNIEFPNFSF